jgi:hypothetical protein
MTGFPNLVSEKESGIWIHEVQARANYQQRGYEKVLDTFLSNYWKGLIGSEMCGDVLIHTLPIL